MIKELRANSGGESHWNDFPINFIKTLYSGPENDSPEYIVIVTCHLSLLSFTVT